MLPARYSGDVPQPPSVAGYRPGPVDPATAQAADAVPTVVGLPVLAGGLSLGGYRLVRQIGAGGMGTVWEAVDDGGAHVAMKVLHPALAADPSARTRLAREAAVLARVRGSSVARVLDVETGDTLAADGAAPLAFVVTELVDGPTLQAEVDDGGPYDPLADAVPLAELARGTAQALTEVHAAGVIHRDLKPSNVMLGPCGPVLIDFGISQLAGQARLTMTGQVTGTPGFVPPEALSGGEPDQAGDWFAWAGVIVFALTGRPPFGTGSWQTVFHRVYEGAVELGDLSQKDPALADVLRRALASDPVRRARPEEVLAVLEARAAGLDGPAGAECVPAEWEAVGPAGPGAPSPREAVDGPAGAGALAVPDGQATRLLRQQPAPQPSTAVLPEACDLSVLPEPAPAYVPSTTALPESVPPPTPAATPAFPAQGPALPATQVWSAPAPESSAGDSWMTAQPPVPTPVPMWQPVADPRLADPPRRPVLALVVTVAAIAVATLAPLVALAVWGVLAVVAGTVGRVQDAWLARARRGQRMGLTAWLVTPWHLARALVAALASVGVGGALSVAVVSAASTLGVLGGERGVAVPWMVGAVVGALGVLWCWLPPWAGPARRCLGRVSRTACSTAPARLLLGGCCVAVVAGVVWAVASGAAQVPDLRALVAW